MIYHHTVDGKTSRNYLGCNYQPQLLSGFFFQQNHPSQRGCLIWGSGELLRRIGDLIRENLFVVVFFCQKASLVKQKKKDVTISSQRKYHFRRSFFGRLFVFFFSPFWNWCYVSWRECRYAETDMAPKSNSNQTHVLLLFCEFLYVNYRIL